MDNQLRLGLEGVVAAETRLSSVDGLAGELLIGGYPLEQVATQSFEAMVYLLWYGALPSAEQQLDFTATLAAQRTLPDYSLQLLRNVSTHSLDPMDVLRMVTGTLIVDQSINHQSAGLMILGRIPTIIATHWRLRQGLTPVAPHPDLGHAANYLYMLTGHSPSAEQARALETYLNTVIDHGLNASTFTARVITSTQSDLVSAVVGAIGALKGPLHGGAPGPALDTVFAIGRADNAEPYLRDMLGRGERLMGFGHRVYKVYDPRAVVLARAAEQLYATASSKRQDLYALATHVEQVALRLLEEHKPGRNLQTNVEYYTALLLHGLDVPVDLFSSTFALARTAGWLAHCFEHIETGRLIRPKARYVGERRSLTDATH